MELFKLLGIIDIDNKNANDALDKTSKKGQETEGKLSKFFNGVGKGAVAVGKAVGTGLAVGGAAMGALTVKALNMSGELEQNMGGSEAVFGMYATKMQRKAESAFSNMGLSTSDYLATANKMGALFQGAGFDIRESLDLSSGAMQRAADVASIMGIDTSSAMEAIAGAAKGNFTMMDNLGVAMNDTTLNAYALEKGIGKTTQEMTNQEKIGLAMEMFMEKTAYAAGNYAKENETLAGSLGTAKAALTNFLDGSGSVDDLVTSFSNAARVIVDNVKTLAPRLISGITDLINQIVPMLPPLLQELLPVIIEGAVSLINGLVEAMPMIISALMSALPALIDGFTQIINALIQALPQMMQILIAALPKLIPQLVDGLVSMIVMLCTNFAQIIQPIIDYLPEIIIAIVEALMNNLPALVDAGKQLLLGLFEGMVQLISKIPDVLKSVWDAIVNGIKKLFGIHSPSTVMMELGKNIIQGLINGVKSLLSNAKEIWTDLKKAVVKTATEIKDGVAEKVKQLKENTAEKLKAIEEQFTTKMEQAKLAVSNKFASIKNSFTTGLTSAYNTTTSKMNSIKESFSSKMEQAKTAVTNKLSNIKDGFSNGLSSAYNTVSSKLGNIKDKFSDIMEGAKKIVSNAIEKIKGAFNFSWSLPHLKLPHISVSGGEAPFGIGGKGSLPHFSVEWYKKAYDNAMLLKNPTIFGYSSESGKFLGGGDGNGSEVVAGSNTLMSMIRAAVSEQNVGLSEVLYRILEAILALDENMGGNLREALAGTSFEINKREFARLVKAVN